MRLFILMGLLFLIACTQAEFTYHSSGYAECDYSTKDSCIQNDCRWKLMTDAISPDEPEPATCCPLNVEETFDNPSNDPCKQIHG